MHNMQDLHLALLFKILFCILIHVYVKQLEYALYDQLGYGLLTVNLETARIQFYKTLVIKFSHYKINSCRFAFLIFDCFFQNSKTKASSIGIFVITLWLFSYSNFPIISPDLLQSNPRHSFDCTAEPVATLQLVDPKGIHAPVDQQCP